MRYSPLFILFVMVGALALSIMAGGVSAYEDGDERWNGDTREWERYDAETGEWEPIGDNPESPITTRIKEWWNNNDVVKLIKGLPEVLWNFFIDKIVGMIQGFFDLWIQFLNGVYDTVHTIFWGIAGVEEDVYESGWGNAILTFNLIVSTILLLGLMGLIRMWVWILDVLPVV